MSTRGFVVPEVEAVASSADFAAGVREGLTRPGQKELHSKYFYDTIGSKLFEAICELPEYGLTRADERLLRRGRGRVRVRGVLAVTAGVGIAVVLRRQAGRLGAPEGGAVDREVVRRAPCVELGLATGEVVVRKAAALEEGALELAGRRVLARVLGGPRRIGARVARGLGGAVRCGGRRPSGLSLRRPVPVRNQNFLLVLMLSQSFRKQ